MKPADEKRPDAAPEPYIVVPVSVLQDPNLTNNDRAVLFQILRHDWVQNDSGCTASVATLAQDSRTSESTVKRVIKKLVAAGYIFAPEAEYRNGERIKTTIRVTARLRPGRKAAKAVKRPDPEQLALSEGGSTVNPPGRKSKRTFSTAFRPDVVREPLIDDDAGRLAQLDAWGCKDSADFLGVLLGLLAEREQSLGRLPTPQRLRAIYDGAASSRILHKSGVDSIPGLLLAGIESRFLLARPKYAKQSVDELPPGARHALEQHAHRVKLGGSISNQMLSDYGVDRAEFENLVRSLGDQTGTGSEGPSADIDCVTERVSGSTINPPPENVGEEIGQQGAPTTHFPLDLRTIIDACAKEQSIPSMLYFSCRSIEVIEDGSEIRLCAPSPFLQQLFSQHVIEKIAGRLGRAISITGPSIDPV